MSAASLEWIDTIPDPLCAPEHKREVARLLAEVPCCSRDIGLECGLVRPGKLYAVGMAVTKNAEATRTLLPRTKDLRLHRLAMRAIVWRRLSAFVLAWLYIETRAFGQRVPFLFLEFDYAPNWHNTPCIFVALDWPLAELEPRFRQQAPFAVPGFQMILQLLILLGRRATAKEARCLALCWQELPDGGAWSHVGVLTSRPAAGHRMSILLPRAAVKSYLERVAPESDFTCIPGLLDRYASLCHFRTPSSRVQLELDVGQQVSGKIGVSLLPREPGAWPQLLDLLVRDGLCDMRCAAAAKSWQRGSDVAQDDADACLPYLSHAKLLVHGHRAVGAKLYFGLRKLLV